MKIIEVFFNEYTKIIIHGIFLYVGFEFNNFNSYKCGSVPNYGLFVFKEIIGCEIITKYSLSNSFRSL